MAWCNDPNDEKRSNEDLILPTITPPRPNNNEIKPNQEIPSITCPSCGHNIEFQDQGGIHELPGLPAGMKFDPNDQEILEHLDAKVASDLRKIHPLIHEFIPTLEDENGICYTHPEKLPGVSKDGQIRHFFHRPSKAYTTGTRKRRKVHTDEDNGSETRWHKTGKTRPVLANGVVKGYKKILVLYTNYGRQKKPEKTNWVMHQYHLGSNEEEKDGELVVSKVFYQTQPRQCGNNNNNNNSIIIKDLPYENVVPRNVVPLDYYNNAHNNYINNYGHVVGHNNDNRESSSSPQLLIPNLVVQGDHGDGSSFFRFAMDHGNNKKARLDEGK